MNIVGRKQVRGPLIRLLRDARGLGERDNLGPQARPAHPRRGGYRRRDTRPARPDRAQAASHLQEGRLPQVPRSARRRGSRGWQEVGFEPSPSEVQALPDSVRYWLPFPDTVNALRALKGTYKLAIISNIDDGLFALTARYLEVEFDYIVTAEQAGTYKPSPNNFELALERIGAAPERILHVAESLFHDHAPAKKMGLDTAWIHRRAAKGGFGATPPAEAEPDLEVPDLDSLVNALGLRGSGETRAANSR